MKGKVVYLFAFDVAAEFRTSDIVTVMSQKPHPFGINLGPAAPKDVRLYFPRVVALPATPHASNLGPVTLTTVIKVFDVGVLSISFDVGFDVPDLATLAPYHQLAVDQAPLQRRAEELCRQVTAELRPFMVKPADDARSPEAYTIFCLETLDGDPERPVTEWVRARRQELAQVLGEESSGPPLDPSQVAEMFRVAQSYSVDDHTVIDWDAALVIDRGGYFDDVLYMIELANLQLEEFRLLDDRLDAFFLRAYDDVDSYFAHRRIIRGPQKVMKSLRSIRMDVTKMSEEVTNITKFVGDWYLARVYLGCKERFHMAHWESSVDQKLNQLDDLYSIVTSEINNRRMLLLEAVIVALFLIDLAALVFIRP